MFEVSIAYLLSSQLNQRLTRRIRDGSRPQSRVFRRISDMDQRSLMYEVETLWLASRNAEACPRRTRRLQVARVGLCMMDLVITLCRHLVETDHL